MTVVVQTCCAAPVIVYYILIPQFLFLAINRYFHTFIEDVEMVIKRFDKKENRDLKGNFVEMINLHSKSLEIIGNYGQIMNAPIFIVNTFNLICMCTILFQVKDSISKRDYAELHLAVTANFVIFQMVFSFCFLGDQITTKASEVKESIYDCNWYNYSSKLQKFIIPTINRAHKPFIFTGYALVSCSLESFKEMLSFVLSAFLMLIKISE
ncbi:odorant receptor 2a-like [Sitodiplosis mosellana]|uniref:odorant receptor 2a-like n=1 Tax=Sitodiplosis mosellana TaxID=263140 RepID=UPI002444F199|nr:odorant receptor 2a-like [Sitodiplosis mosellana]